MSLRVRIVQPVGLVGCHFGHVVVSVSPAADAEPQAAAFYRRQHWPLRRWLAVAVLGRTVVEVAGVQVVIVFVGVGAAIGHLVELQGVVGQHLKRIAFRQE